jgi:para-nitrobenzyl esterase
MTIVATRSGKIEGFERDGILQFRGIPYATPPVGLRRWMPPQREEAWDGVRDATKFSAQSAQTEFQLTKVLGQPQPPYSEDSLYLNVYTPACDDAARPVMFWIHGGAFIWGAADTPVYNGTRFAQHGDVVVVTINYRLGPFGYLYLPELFGDDFASSGNLGLLDQVAALEWVRDCIAAFGGDPERVTIFGESAGGASVGTLLGTPAARGLFRNAIAQSGAASWISDSERATAVAADMVARLGVRPGGINALRAVTTDDVLGALPEWRETGDGGLPFQPVHDGVVLPQPPLAAIAGGSAAGVHVLAGTNKDEITLFQFSDLELGQLDYDGLVERVRAWCGDTADALVADYASRRPDTSIRDLWLGLATEGVFRFPATRLLETQAAHAPVWSYIFTWETIAFGGLLRSTHTLELPFVFDNIEGGGMEVITGSGPEVQRLADAMHRAWIAFAHTGNPHHDGLPAWPAYDVRERSTMRFDVACEVLFDPDAADRRAFDAAVPA